MKVCPNCGKQYPDDANFCHLDAGKLTSAEAKPAAAAGPAAAAPGRQSGDLIGGRFKLGESLGGGLTGEVHRAVDTTDQRACAIKLVDTSVFPSSLLMQRTERELKQLARVDHPNIAKVLGHGRDGDTLWIATELCEGVSLHDAIIDQGPMDPQRASQIIGAVGAALGAAAKVGVIHRDLGPKNMLLMPGGEVKLINFGVAAPEVARVAGVPEFVAPEMIEGKAVDQRANIYSLGATFYYLLTGQAPHMGAPEEVHAKHLEGEVEPPSELVPGLPELVDMVVLKALERHSRKRFMTLRQLLDVVGQMAEGDFEIDAAAISQQMASVKGKGKARSRSISATMLGFSSSSATMKAVTQEEAEKAAQQAAQREAEAAMGDERPSSTQPMGSAANIAAAAEEAQAARTEAPKPALIVPDEHAGPTIPTPVLDPATGEPMDGSGSAPGSSAVAASGAPGAADEVITPAPKQPQAPTLPRDDAAGAKGAAAAAAAAGQKGGDADESSASKKRRKDKFRETLWFKKGEMDAEAAEQAAKERSDAPTPDKADLLPIEDRYDDDGTLTRADRDKFSLKTGSTQSMAAFSKKPTPAGDVSDRELIEEMKGGRGKIIIGIVVGLVILVAVIIFAATSGGHDADDADDGKPKIELPPENAPTPGTQPAGAPGATPTTGS